MSEHLYFFLLAFAFASAVTMLGYRLGFYSISERFYEKKALPSLQNLVVAFGLFLIIEVLFAPLLAGLYVWTTGEKLTLVGKGWFTIGAILLSSLALVIYSWLLPRIKRLVLYSGNGPERSFFQLIEDFFTGAFTWFLSYPWVVALVHLIALVMLLFGPLPDSEQVAVKQLKLSQQDPALFICMLATIIGIVPIAEELLFRGFLQRALLAFFGRWAAILLASLVFAFFHFSSEQGLNNIELILSLFLLSCYLGFIYEKRGSIWAPIGLHMAFNAISVAAIIWQGETLYEKPATIFFASASHFATWLLSY